MEGKQQIAGGEFLDRRKGNSSCKDSTMIGFRQMEGK